MIHKIQDNIKIGKYTQQIPMNSTTAYVAGKYGWTDYLFGDQLIFSHRINTYAPEAFPEDLHIHDYYELIICAGGNGMQYIADGQYLSVKPGTAILSHPMSVHIYRPIEPVLYNRYVLYFKPTLNIFLDKSIMNFLNNGKNSNLSLYFSENNSFCNYVTKAEQELSNTNSPYASAMALLHICNLFIALSNSDINNADLTNSYIPNYLYEIKEYVDKEYLTINSIAELAEKFHYSREYITRSFSNYFNTPLYEYILKRKILHCCTLLNQGESVEKSAMLSGFRNRSGFTRVFRKFNGCTPSEYKAKNHY